MFNSSKSTSSNSRILSAIIIALGMGVLFAPTSHAEKDAFQIELKNCGGYTIGRTDSQYRKKGDKNWKTIKSNGEDVELNQAICVDFSQYTDSNGEPEFDDDYEIRLVAYIAGGSTVKCDSTNYPKDSGESDNRRKMVMKGTTYNNNGCRSKSYGNAYGDGKCSSGGEVYGVTC